MSAKKWFQAKDFRWTRDQRHCVELAKTINFHILCTRIRIHMEKISHLQDQRKRQELVKHIPRAAYKRWHVSKIWQKYATRDDVEATRQRRRLIRRRQHINRDHPLLNREKRKGGWAGAFTFMPRVNIVTTWRRSGQRGHSGLFMGQKPTQLLLADAFSKCAKTFLPSALSRLIWDQRRIF